MRTPRTERAFTWFIGFALVALASIAVDAAQAPPAKTLRESLAPYLDAPAVYRPIQTAVVLQKSDCYGNFRMLHLLNRENVRGRMKLNVIWYEGAVSDSTAIRSLLPKWAKAIPLVPLERSVLARLRELGHESTPMLLVLDQNARIRFATQSPRSAREFAGLTKIVEGLTWIEEL